MVELSNVDNVTASACSQRILARKVRRAGYGVHQRATERVTRHEELTGKRMKMVSVIFSIDKIKQKQASRRES